MAGEGAVFPTVLSEGGLLPPDLLQRIVEQDPELGGLAPTDYGLGPRERLGEAIARAWQRARAYWAAFQAATEDLPPNESGVEQTRHQWVLPLLRALGYAPEYQAAGEELGGRVYRISHRDGPVPIHIVSCRQELDRVPPASRGDARLSPHALVQEYLNTRPDALYGLVTNGVRLRLLRDHHSLTRLAYVEWDLAAIFAGGVYADFALLWLTLHRSRLPRAGAEPSACHLERWRERAETRGVRAFAELRKGVERALVALGTGLLAHPANERLCERLRAGVLTTEAFYAQLLRLVYRLLFLAVAEERDLLFPADAEPAARRRYARAYSLTRLRDQAWRYLDDGRHDDWWRALTLVFDLLAGRRTGLGLAPLDGGLFDSQACPDLDAPDVRLSNAALAEALLHLSRVRVDKRWRRVSYRDLNTEELGGIYEALLDYQPRVVVDAASPRFELVESSARKQTGSYYTPPALVQELVRAALEPVIADRLARARTDAERERALLGITVCDPAAGSGHFLVAAARRLAAELARVRAGDREPSPPERRQALRDVVRQCLYGVDRNPLAVDLCRLSLWLESHDPGRALTFLDHHIKCGDSLVGVWDLGVLTKGVPDGAYKPVEGDDPQAAARYRKRNQQERAGQLDLFAPAVALPADLARDFAELGAASDDTPADVARKVALYLALRQRGSTWWDWKVACDLWTAAFYVPLRASGASGDAVPTTGTVRAYLARPAAGHSELVGVATELALRHRFFHWPLEFPDVWAAGGFDVVLGNPPWERIKLQEQEFFEAHAPAIAQAPNKAARAKLIAALPQTDPALAAEFAAAKRAAEATSKFVRASERFPLTAVGDVNYYALFAELSWRLLNPRGRAGIIVPTGIATDDSTKRYFQAVVERGALAALFDFENRGVFFPGVHASYKFCLLVLAAARQPRTDFAFFLTDVAQLHDPRRRFALGPHDLALLNPNTRTCPVFRTAADAELTRAIYRRVPALVDERAGANPWGVQFLRMFD
ncbi:MAG: N-6 DNA methylase, partial [Chloroflexi bacterium]|nr:N-6 DNA methylase [Chloroflexota bacterium]